MASGIEFETLSDGIVSATRAALGDELRSVVLFTPEDYEVAYLRSDLYPGDDAHATAVKESLVEIERQGFTETEVYGTLASIPEVEPELGTYRYTVRAFSRGYLCRVIVDDRGVIVTTDELDVDSFDHLSVTLRSLLGLSLESESGSDASRVEPA